MAASSYNGDCSASLAAASRTALRMKCVASSLS